MTLDQITRMDTYIPSLRMMQLAVENCAATYGKAAQMASEAYRCYDEAIDANECKEVRDDLYYHYEFALQLQHETYQQWNDAKRALLQYAN